MTAASLQSIVRSKHTFSSCSKLISHCLSSKSLLSAESAHACLTKTGLHRLTLLANRLIYLYSRLGAVESSLQVFRCLPNKNTFTWNILIAAFARTRQMGVAHHLFEEMPKRDTVSWNSMVSGYIRNGDVEKAIGILYQMGECGLRPSRFTLSIASSCVTSAWQVKQIHGRVIRNKLGFTNVVVCNSILDKYGKFGLLEYVIRVFNGIEVPDIVSWNSVISGCERCGQHEKALHYFGLMRTALSPDQFTMSIVISVCANIQDSDKGEQAFALCFKIGYVSNTIVSSAVIGMYSQCGRLDNSVKFFEEMPRWDMAICNSMVSGFARSGLSEEAQRLLVCALREGFNPTEFTFSSILRSNSDCTVMESGAQTHSMVFKLGLYSEMIVASALMDIYAKLGSVDSAMKVFSEMVLKDLASWNTMIRGLAENGKGIEALWLFEELQEQGFQPDRITLVGVLSACSINGLVDEGIHIFMSMEKKYLVNPGVEHYSCMVNLMAQAGRLEESVEMIKSMPGEPSATVWCALLEACQIHGNLKLAELAAEKVIELDPDNPLAYSVLTLIYGTRGRWESVARMTRTMKERGVEKMGNWSWIGIWNYVFSFDADQFLHHGGENMYSMLRLLIWEMRRGLGEDQ